MGEVRAEHRPFCSRARGLACGDPFQISRVQDFQVLLSLQPRPLGNAAWPPHMFYLGWLDVLFFSFCTLQVGVTVLEAQKLVGVNINPYVAVRVGEQRRVTATQRGTNCPFYNEVGATKEAAERREWSGPKLRTVHGGDVA